MVSRKFLPWYGYQKGSFTDFTFKQHTKYTINTCVHLSGGKNEIFAHDWNPLLHESTDNIKSQGATQEPQPTACCP